MGTGNRSFSTASSELLRRLALQGDREAIGQLFALHIPNLYRSALYILKNHQDAEDALQDGLLSAFRNLSAFKGHSQLSTWLHRIVINAALMQLRRRRSAVVTSLDAEVTPNAISLANTIHDRKPNPEETYARLECVQYFRQRLHSLPAPQRRAIWLCGVRGLKVREAAHALGLPTGSLRSQVHRAKLRLREEIAGSRRG